MPEKEKDGNIISDSCHLLLTEDKMISQGIFDSFCDSLKIESLVIERKVLPPRGAQMALEDYMPTFAVIYFTKPFFDEFLKLAAQDFYSQLKESLKNIHGRVRFHPFTRGTKKEYSTIFSVYAIHDRMKAKTVKFLIRNECSEEEFAEGILAFTKLFEAYYSGVPGNQLEINLDAEEGRFGHLLISFELETKSLEVVDPLTDKLEGKDK